MSKEATLAPGGSDAARPAAFYLRDKQEVLESLADATLIVQGVELPVHSQVPSRLQHAYTACLSCVAAAIVPPPTFCHISRPANCLHSMLAARCRC